jgi:hypothetical protein
MKFPLRHISYKHWAWDKVNGVGHNMGEFKLRRIRIDKLVGTQPSVRLLGVKHASSYGRPILTVRVGGVIYIRDGHHRVTRAVQRGQKTILAWVKEG